METTAPDFVHLHLHTDYSFLDGILKIPQMLAKVKADGMKAVAVTDHGNMHGAIRFYKAAKKAGIKPIIGSELYFTHDPASRSWESMFHLTVLAKNEEGYHNLCRMVSAAHAHFWHRPRVTPEILARYSRGLVGMSACIGGEIAQLIRLEDDLSAARARALEYAEIFDGDFYFEIMHNGYKELEFINRGLAELSRTTDIPLVATNDVHYLEKDDWKLRALVSRNEKNVDVSEESEHGELWLRTRAEMALLHEPEHMARACSIADACNVELTLGKSVFPRYEAKLGTPDEEIAILAREGLIARGKADDEEYRERLEHELSQIIQNGFSTYLLIVADFIREARRKGIPVGPGRGSAAGSLVCYCLEITDLDPLPYNLLFERFINPERVSLPDIDVDFCERRRPEMIRYMIDKYGKDQVAQIANYSTMQARQAIKDIARSMARMGKDLPLSEVNRIAALVDPSIKPTDSKGVIDQLLERGVFDDEKARNPHVGEMLDYAARAEGLCRGLGVHAAGIVVADTEILDYSPTWMNLSKNAEGAVVTQYDKKDIEEAGLVKIDFLGLRNMTVIDSALANIRKTGLEPPDMRHIPLDDEETFALYARGEMDGVFQMESAGMRKYLAQLKPTRFEDLIALIALYRPGPLGSGMTDVFVERRNGRAVTEYFGLDEFLKDILEPTCGVIVYQEQVMQIARRISGFTLGQADILRRAMGKKNPKEMASQREGFISGAVKNGVPEEKAVMLFDMIAKFAEYGFNKSHSAAYALISYQTAYLKAHHYAAFMAALMESEKSDVEKLGRYVAIAREKCQVLLPDVFRSETDFSVDTDGNILFGLSGIKNVPAKSLEALMYARKRWQEEGRPRNLVDLLAESPEFNMRFLEAMNKAGAFDSLILSSRMRSTVDAHAKEILKKARARSKEAGMAGPSAQASLFALVQVTERERPAGIGMDLPLAPPWGMSEQFANEIEILGFRASPGHPLDEYVKKEDYAVIPGMTRMRDILEPSRERISVFAHVDELRTRPRRADGKLFATGVISDGERAMPFKCWADTWAEIGGDAGFVQGGCYRIDCYAKEDTYNSPDEGKAPLELVMTGFSPLSGDGPGFGKRKEILSESTGMSDERYRRLKGIMDSIRAGEADADADCVFVSFRMIDRDSRFVEVPELSGLVRNDERALAEMEMVASDVGRPTPDERPFPDTVRYGGSR